MNAPKQNKRIKPISLLLPLALAGWASGCMVDQTIEGDELTDEALASDIEDGAESTAQASSELSSALSCQQDNDCRSSCRCSNSQCIPHGISPQPPAGYCDMPPTRACNSSSDCKDGCSCGSNNQCIQGVQVSPPNPYPRCHLPPADSFEPDNSPAQWKPYTGTAQRHNFHHVNDRDFVAVYFGQAGDVRFRTHSLANRADTKLRIYKFDNGAFVSEHDDIGGWFFDPNSQSSRVDLSVPANSTYLIEIINMSPASIWTTQHQFPEYTFEISALN